MNLQLSASQSLSAGTFVLQIGKSLNPLPCRRRLRQSRTPAPSARMCWMIHQMDNLLAIGRDAMSLVRVMPGVVGVRADRAWVLPTPDDQRREQRIQLATIDGVTGNTRGLLRWIRRLNLDAIKEVTVMASNYQAQYGKTAGANINFVTKSGTQQFHGGALLVLPQRGLQRQQLTSIN